MSEYRRQNFMRSAPVFADGDVLVECNCSQVQPHTPFGGKACGLLFVRCNLRNCDLPDGAVVEGGLHIHREPSPPPAPLTAEQQAEQEAEFETERKVREQFEPQIQAAVTKAVADVRRVREDR